MGKRYYSQEEACAKLDMTPEQLKDLVRDGELREFRDAGKINYKADEVDRIAAEAEVAEATDAGALSGSLSALDMLGTGELKLEDSNAEMVRATEQPAEDEETTPPSLAGDDSGELRFADEDDTALGASPSKSADTEPPAMGSDSLTLAIEEEEPKPDDTEASGTGELMLEPVDEGDSGIRLGTDVGGDAVSLEDTSTDEDDREGTVVSSIGVSVFDEDDVEKEADPLAKTVVSSGSGSGSLGIEGIGSGSGLLDLTRESDDTSLGAELLDEIYPGEEGGSEMGEATRAGLEDAIPEAAGGSATFEPAETAEPATATATAVATTVRYEFEPDAFAKGLTGMLFVGVLIMCIAGLTAAAATRGIWPSLLEIFAERLWLVSAVSFGAAVIALGIGFFLGKRSGS